MKYAKRIASLLLALVMVLAVTTTAFAAGTNSITVNNAQAGENYNIYKMLDLSVNEDNSAYSYTVNAAWENFFKTGAGNNYVKIDTEGYVTWNADKSSAADKEAFAKAAAAYAADSTNNVSVAAAAITPSTDGQIKFEGLDAGYYLITSTTGTLAMVDTTPDKTDVVVNEKNPDTTIDKQVKEDSKNEYGDKNDADIGDIIEFQVTVNVKKGAKNYVMHDQMTTGLTFNADSVNIAGLTKGTDYTVVTTGLKDGCTFEIRFAQTYLDKIAADTALTVTYTATLNSNAKAGIAETNKAQLTWGDKSHTAWDETKTYTWDLDVLKYANDDKTVHLANAKFVLLNNAKDKVATVVGGKLTGWVAVPAAGNDESIAWPANTELTTDKDGKIHIVGLDSDTYYLRETVAPAGFNKLANDVEVKIETTNSADGKTLTYTAVTAEISNKSGTELPSTGGMGTTLFYVLGGILVAAAVVLLVTKKRMRTNG